MTAPTAMPSTATPPTSPETVATTGEAVVRELVVTLTQSARFGAAPRSEQVLPTTDHVPGSVVRGAYAAAWIREHGAPSDLTGARREEFTALFEGGVRYGPLTVGGPVRPLSLRQHKYPAQAGCERPEIDLVDLLDSPADLARGCPDCDSPWEQERGFRERPPRTARVSLEIGERGVARRGQIVTREQLTPRDRDGELTRLSGAVVGPAPLLAALDGLDRLRLGGNRSTHGAVDTTLTATTPELADLVEVRDPGPGTATRVVLRLASPAVLVDGYGRPVRQPDPAELAAVLGVELRLEADWTRWEQVGGWHAASGLPKPDDLAVAAGSTFVYAATSEPSPAARAGLALRGVGLRRHEGFGHLAPRPQLPGISDARIVDELSGIRDVVWEKRVKPALSGDAAQRAAVEGMLSKIPQGLVIGDVLARPPVAARRLLAQVEARRQARSAAGGGR